MFRLTTKLACSNLIKNRKLYYPFAIAVILAVTIAYLFDSLTFNPHIHELRGGDPMIFTLVLGLFVVNAAGAIIVLYANSFVMKNRSKELGIYSMLGLEKRHLISMIFKELLMFGFLTISVGVLIGALFDKLIFAFLLKLMKMKVHLPTWDCGLSFCHLWSHLCPFGSSQRLADSSFECSATDT